MVMRFVATGLRQVAREERWRTRGGRWVVWMGCLGGLHGPRPGAIVPVSSNAARDPGFGALCRRRSRKASINIETKVVWWKDRYRRWFASLRARQCRRRPVKLWNGHCRWLLER